MKKFTVIIATFAMFLAACGKSPNAANDAANQNAPASANALNSTGSTDTASNTGSAPAPFAGKHGDPSSVEAAKSNAANQIVIAAGTPITVRLQNAVSSASSNSGDRFEAVLDQPLTANGRTIAPAGATVTGRVVSAHRSGHLKDPGSLSLSLASLTIDGKSVPVNTTTVSAKGESHKKRNWAMIGGGAGGGALIGGLMGGGKGALIGSAVGAGAGTTAAYTTGKKDVGFGVERRLTFRLRDQITL